MLEIDDIEEGATRHGQARLIIDLICQARNVSMCDRRYQVSGEFSTSSGGRNGWIDQERMMMEI